MRTPFSEEDKKHSDNAHIISQDIIYPMFMKKPLIFEDTQLDGNDIAGQILDAEFAVDRIVKDASYSFNVQERFRRKDYYNREYRKGNRLVKYKNEISITYYNNNSRQMSEWEKIQKGLCHLFIYGFFDPATGRFLRWVIVDGVRLGRICATDKICYSQFNNGAKNQDVRYIELKDLHEAGCLLLCSEDDW